MSINSAANGAVSERHEHEFREQIRESRVRLDWNRCDIPTSPNARRSFEIDGLPANLTIATSQRPYQMIVSYVLQIVLRDHFNLDRVVVRRLDPKINQFDQTEILKKIRSRDVPDDPARRFPETMINVEVWRDSGYGADKSFSNFHSVHYAGSLAAQGLFGWWMPRVWMNQRRSDDGIPWDHYIILTMKDKVESLAIPASDLRSVISAKTSCEALKSHEKPRIRRRLRSWECDGGVLRSPACQRETSPCATLLAADPLQLIGRGHLVELLTSQIEGIAGALVNLAFLGPNMEEFVLNRLNASVYPMKGTLFFNWTPNPLTACDSPGAENLTLDSPFEAKTRPKHRLSCVSHQLGRA